LLVGDLIIPIGNSGEAMKVKFLKVSSFFFFVLVFPTIAFPSETGIHPQKAAQYIHAVIEANRTIYSEYIVERMEKTVGLKSTENWKEENALPLPAQFLALSSQIINKKNLGLDYRLLSQWPINPQNKPISEIESAGLTRVSETPNEPYFEIISQKGGQLFKAIFPDKAVTNACVNCHNNHPNSSKKDFKLGDVMGAISLSIPIGKNSGSKDDINIPPEIVSDYIHSVVEADRTVYSEIIVNRLQKINIAFASENWWEEDALLLPAQFLLNASDLIIDRMRNGLDFKLISLWPINRRNGAATKFERNGLEYVGVHPLRPYIGVSQAVEKSYFQAIYPDFAVTDACVQCHNNHPQSPKKDFKLGDVMGGVLITIPLKN
jgi:hypothetical protein